MYIPKKLRRLHRLHQLIRLRATGTPTQLAEQLDVSPATIFRDLEWLRTADAPVVYDEEQQTYIYREAYEFPVQL